MFLLWHSPALSSDTNFTPYGSACQVLVPVIFRQSVVALHTGMQSSKNALSRCSGSPSPDTRPIHKSTALVRGAHQRFDAFRSERGKCVSGVKRRVGSKGCMGVAAPCPKAAFRIGWGWNCGRKRGALMESERGRKPQVRDPVGQCFREATLIRRSGHSARSCYG